MLRSFPWQNSSLRAMGDVVICLDQPTVDRLTAMRCPGESYSEVIIRIARG